MAILKDGTRVSITDGQCKGLSGVVVGYHNHDPITYAVMLDAPFKVMAQKEIVVNGKTMIDPEEVMLTRVEVEESAVAAV